MTIVAFDGQMLYADGLATEGCTIVGTKTKKIAKHKGFYVAGAGSASNLNEALSSEIPLDRAKESSVLLYIYPDKVIYVDDQGWHEAEVPVAIGTGSSFALAAMKAGCNAKEAVKIACQLDTHSGGTIKGYKVVF